MMQVLTSGAMNLVQDAGRSGHLHLGVCASGAMDPLALRYANSLVGNAADAAGIELAIFPFRVRFERDSVFACTGADARIELDGRLIAPWWSSRVAAGQTLEIQRPARGMRVYLAVAGGVDVAPVLGSRSTDLKAGLGGMGGRGLKRLDMLALGAASAEAPRRAGLGCVPGEVPALLAQIAQGCVSVRVLPAAEYEEFSADSRQRFEAAPWQVTPDSNRQGYRLQGAQTLQMAQRRELLSHGLVPGTVQVPPAGQPIIQLAEANTCGGYPKIATVIEADQWRLGQVPAGCALRFERVDVAQAVSALRAQHAAWQALAARLPLVATRLH